MIFRETKKFDSSSYTCHIYSYVSFNYWIKRYPPDKKHRQARSRYLYSSTTLCIAGTTEYNNRWIVRCNDGLLPNDCMENCLYQICKVECWYVEPLGTWYTGTCYVWNSSINSSTWIIIKLTTDHRGVRCVCLIGSQVLLTPKKSRLNVDWHPK